MRSAYYNILSLLGESDLFYLDYSTFQFGRGSLSTEIAYVNCRGSESSLAECSFTTSTSSINNCNRYSGNTIGVHCKSSKHALTDFSYRHTYIKITVRYCQQWRSL